MIEIHAVDEKKDSAPTKVSESNENIAQLDYKAEYEKMSSNYWFLMGKISALVNIARASEYSLDRNLVTDVFGVPLYPEDKDGE